MKNLGILFVFLASLLVISSANVLAAPIPVAIDWVEVEDAKLDPTSQTSIREEFQAEDELDVTVRLTTPTDVEDVTVTAFIITIITFI